MSANQWGGVLVRSQKKAVVQAIVEALTSAGLDGVSVHFTAIKGTRLTWAELVADPRDVDTFLEGTESGGRIGAQVSRAVGAPTWCVFNNDYVGTFAVAVDARGKRRWSVSPERDEANRERAQDAELAAEAATSDKAAAKARARALAARATTALGRLGADLGEPWEARFDEDGGARGPATWRAKRRIGAAPATRTPPAVLAPPTPPPVGPPEAGADELFAALAALGPPPARARVAPGSPQTIEGPPSTRFVAAWGDRVLFSGPDGVVWSRAGSPWAPLPVQGQPWASPAGLVDFRGQSIGLTVDDGATWRQLGMPAGRPLLWHPDGSWWFARGTGALVQLGAQGWVRAEGSPVPLSGVLATADGVLAFGLSAARWDGARTVTCLGLPVGFYEAGVSLDDGTVLLSTQVGVARSVDGGRTFARADEIEPFTRAVSLGPQAVVAHRDKVRVLGEGGRVVLRLPLPFEVTTVQRAGDAVWVGGPEPLAVRWHLE